MKKQFTNLDEVIKELNAPTIYEDGEIMESEFEFEYRIINNVIELYDKNENYNYNYLDNLNSISRDVCWEFGFDFEPITEDEVMEKLLKAVKKDFGNETFIEWQDYTIMNIVK